MAASQPAKFAFDLDLSGGQRQARLMSESRIAQLQDAARAEGYAEGLAEGERTEVARAAAALTTAGQKIANDAAALIKRIDAADRQSRSEGLELARAIGSKLAARLVAARPEVELEALIAECLSSLDRAPHLVVRCNPALADKLQEITEAHMAAAGFTGRLIVLPDADIAPGDGRLEWADGGLVRDMNAILAEIDAAIAGYCTASGLTAPAPRPEPIERPAPPAETDNE